MNYEHLLVDVQVNGKHKADRTGTGTRSVFGRQIRYDLSKGFPLITTKKVHFKSVVVELLWFLRGDSNTAFLKEHGVSIWDEWADNKGELGPVYGVQWRKWETRTSTNGYRCIDQITQLVREIKRNPDSRRHLVSAWNVSDLQFMALAPCHFAFQCYVIDNTLSLQVYQRSADMFLGVPFNLASYALLTHMLAQQCDMAVGELIWTGGDCHIYDNHQEQVKLQLSRDERALPVLSYNRKPESIFDYRFDDFSIIDYNPHPAIKAPVAV